MSTVDNVEQKRSAVIQLWKNGHAADILQQIFGNHLGHENTQDLLFLVR